jgi:hypothetical protein
MGFKPNFTSATIKGDKVTVKGASDEEDTDDIVSIHVTLVQGDRVAGGPLTRFAAGEAARVTSVWNVSLPVQDPAQKAGDLQAGPVAAFGVETRSTNATTITWAQSLDITE